MPSSFSVKTAPGIHCSVLHGFGGTGDDWAHVFDLDVLSREYRLIAPDARDHGRSTNPTGKFGFLRCALDVLVLMDRLHVDRIRAIGMSLGAKTLLTRSTRCGGFQLDSPTTWRA